MAYAHELQVERCSTGVAGAARADRFGAQRQMARRLWCPHSHLHSLSAP